MRKILIAIMLTLAVGMTFAAMMNSSHFLVKAQPTTQVKIMPLGDSITSGYPGVEGYRKDLYWNLTEFGLNVDFVGSQKNGTGFDNDNEGHLGYSADQIRDDVTGWLVSNPADVVLLHIGTNDIQSEQNVSEIVAEVGGILDNIYQWGVNNNRTVTVILARIILSDNSTLNSATMAYNDELQTMASTRIANGSRLIMVDMEHALIYPTDLGLDGIHPTEAGYEKMSAVWYNSLINILGYSLTVNYVGYGIVNSLPDRAIYPYGTMVNLTAIADIGWTFSHWSGDLVGSVNPASITMENNMTVNATFTENVYTLLVTINPVAGGSVLANISGPYHFSDNVTLTPTANLGYSFSGWSGDGTAGVGNTWVVTITGNMTVTASFTQNQYQLTMATNFGSVSPESDNWYTYGSSVTIYAVSPSVGGGERYVWNGWTGSGSGSYTGLDNNTNLVTMNGPVTETASWTVQYYLTVSSAYGYAGGGGWYDAGSSAYATISPTTVTGSSGVQYVFSGWSGDTSGSYSTSNVIVMDGPKTATVNWSPVHVATPTPTPTATPTPTPTPTAAPTPSPTFSPSPSPLSSPFDGNTSLPISNTLVVEVAVLGVVLIGGIAGIMVIRRRKK
jgi:uncharacterized repeat protein (TIGR02543 family)